MLEQPAGEPADDWAGEFFLQAVKSIFRIDNFV